jgi:thiamine biosynthesis lipoprotein
VEDSGGQFAPEGTETDPNANAPPHDSAPAGEERSWTWLLLLLALVAVVGLGSAVGRLFYGERSLAVRDFSGEALGTTWTVKVVLPEGISLVLLEAIRDTIQANLDEVNRLMSTWDASSEISRFNSHDSREPFALSPPTLAVLEAARIVGERTGGALDITVGPLVEAWGFGPGAGDPSDAIPPDEETVDSLRVLTGLDRIRIDKSAGTAAKADSEVKVDLSAVAKGYAVDRVTGGLVDLSLADFAVEVGGEVRSVGGKPDGTAWRVGIEAPEPGTRRMHGSVELHDEAVATSGDYRNFYERDGVRYAHVIDPRTGYPVRLTGFSVAVLHNEAMYADAWATALAVLGPEEGLRTAEREELAAVFLVQSETGLRELPTTAWQERNGL